MAISKEMEDWFLRGGKRPEMNGMQKPPDEIPVDDDEEDLDDDDDEEEDLDDDDDEEPRDFMVTLTRTKTIRQKTTMRVSATTANEAMDRAEDEVSDFDGDWEDVPGSEEYEDCEADDAEEAD